MRITNIFKKERPKALSISDKIIHVNLELNEIEINTIVAALAQVTPNEILGYGTRNGREVMGYKEFGHKIEGMEYWEMGYGHESLIRKFKEVLNNN